MNASEGVAWEGPVRSFGRRASGPTVQRIVLGAQLRRLREAREITTERAAEAIRGSHSKISRMEHGRVGFKDRDVSDLLTLYGVTDPRRTVQPAGPGPGGGQPRLVARLR